MGKSVFLPFVIIKLVFIYTERHMMKHLISALFLSCNLACLAAQEITIIPKPVEMHQGKGSFQLNPQTIITYQTTLRPQAEYLQEVIAASTGWDLKITEGKPVSGSIHLAQNTSSGQAEAYNLVVSLNVFTLKVQMREVFFMEFRPYYNYFPVKYIVLPDKKMYNGKRQP